MPYGRDKAPTRAGKKVCWILIKKPELSNKIYAQYLYILRQNNNIY
jgi:hypothetical protein